MLFRFKYVYWAGAVIAVGLMLLCGRDGALAQTAQVTASVCQRCHETGLPLPASHPKITGAAITECAPLPMWVDMVAPAETASAICWEVAFVWPIDATTPSRTIASMNAGVAGHSGEMVTILM